MSATVAPDRPRVDVIVGVHNEARPVERVTGSALASAAPVRVTVVAHNTDPNGIQRRLGVLGDDPRVRVVHLADGVRSPANAYNRGIEESTAEFLSIIGSDDEFAAGAIDAWLALADSAEADVVIAPVLRTNGGIGTTPRPRPGRRTQLDGDRDRLFERSAPLGLIRRASFPELRLTNGVLRGEDQAYALHLWFSGASVAFDPTLPPYLEHADQDDRVTRAPASLAEDFAFLDAVEGDPVFRAMAPAARRAYAAKTMRVLAIDAVLARADDSGLDEESSRALAIALERLRGWAREPDALNAREDCRLLDAAAAGPQAAAEFVRLLSARRAPGRSLSRVLPSSPWLVFHRHAPLRSLLAHRRMVRAMARARSA